MICAKVTKIMHRLGDKMISPSESKRVSDAVRSRSMKVVSENVWWRNVISECRWRVVDDMITAFTPCDGLNGILGATTFSRAGRTGPGARSIRAVGVSSRTYD